MTCELGDLMVEDERFKLLTFTCRPPVGWRMKERAGQKKSDPDTQPRSSVALRG